jgi:hypothetical protein
MIRFIFAVDSLSTWVGKAFGWLILIITDGQWPPRMQDVEETESLILQEQKIHAGEHAQQTHSGR